MEKITPKDVIKTVPSVKVVWIGQDLFIEKQESHVADDLHQEVRDVQASS